MGLKKNKRIWLCGIMYTVQLNRGENSKHQQQCWLASTRCLTMQTRLVVKLRVTRRKRKNVHTHTLTSFDNSRDPSWRTLDVSWLITHQFNILLSLILGNMSLSWDFLRPLHLCCLNSRCHSLIVYDFKGHSIINRAISMSNPRIF